MSNIDDEYLFKNIILDILNEVMLEMLGLIT